MIDKLQAAQKTAAELDEETSSNDDMAEALIDAIDVLLEPQGDEAQPAKDVLGELWREDELGLDWLNAFSTTLGEEADARRRPTSSRGKGA